MADHGNLRNRIVLHRLQNLGNERPRLVGQLVGFETELQGEMTGRRGQRRQGRAENPLHFRGFHHAHGGRPAVGRHERRMTLLGQVDRPELIADAGAAGCAVPIGEQDDERG